MDSIIRNVKDIDTADRLALEHILGGQLQENQQLFIRVISESAAGKCRSAKRIASSPLPCPTDAMSVRDYPNRRSRRWRKSPWLDFSPPKLGSALRAFHRVCILGDDD
jgi:hypothetical protein